MLYRQAIRKGANGIDLPRYDEIVTLSTMKEVIHNHLTDTPLLMRIIQTTRELYTHYRLSGRNPV
jgi:hypothetical protein